MAADHERNDHSRLPVRGPAGATPTSWSGVAPRRLRTLLTRYRALAREAIGRFGGAEIKTEGDSFYVVFDSVSSAVRCGLAIVADARLESIDEPIRVGVGIHAGETIEADGGYVGSPVNIAARICAQAGPGEVLVSETVRALTMTLLPVTVQVARPPRAEGHRRADRAVRGRGGGRRGDRMALVTPPETAFATGAHRAGRRLGDRRSCRRGRRLAGVAPVHRAPVGEVDDRRAHPDERAWRAERHRHSQRGAARRRPGERGRASRRRGTGREGI